MFPVDLDKLSKPADTLIKKISKGVGGLAVPWQIKRVAEAKIEAAHSAAEVAHIEAHSEMRWPTCVNEPHSAELKKIHAIRRTWRVSPLKQYLT